MSDQTIEQRIDEIRKEILFFTGEPRDRFQYNGIDSTNDTDRIMESITTLLNEARIEMRKYISVEYIECNGFKCRLPWCGSCSGEEEAFALSAEYEKELEQLTPQKEERSNE